MRECFFFLPNSALPFSDPHLPSNTGPKAYLDWHRLSAVWFVWASSSSETYTHQYYYLMLQWGMKDTFITFLSNQCPFPFPFLNICYSHDSSLVAITICFLHPVTFNVSLCVGSHPLNVAKAAVTIRACRERER